MQNNKKYNKFYKVLKINNELKVNHKHIYLWYYTNDKELKINKIKNNKFIDIYNIYYKKYIVIIYININLFQCY